MPIGGAWSTRDLVIECFGVTTYNATSPAPLLSGPRVTLVNVGIASIRLAREIGHRVAIQTSWTERRELILPLRCRTAGDDSHIVGDHAQVVPVERARI